MNAADENPSPKTEFEGQLDQLVPRPWSPKARSLCSAALLGLVIAGSLAWWMGALYPNPQGQSSGSNSGVRLEVAELDGQQVLFARMSASNLSESELRLAKIELVSSNLELLKAEAEVASADDCVTVGTTQACEGSPRRILRGTPEGVTTALPATSPAHDSLQVYVWMSVDACPIVGQIELTYDFGEGALRWWSRAVVHPITVMDDHKVMSAEGPIDLADACRQLVAAG